MNSQQGQQGNPQTHPHSIHFAPSLYSSRPESLLSGTSSSASSASDAPFTSATERFMRRATEILRGLWRAFLISAVILVLTLFMMACIGLVLAFFSAFGSLLVYVGNAVLREAGHAGYTDDQSAAMVGASGGVLSTLLFGLFSTLLSEPGIATTTTLETPPVLVQLASSILIGTLSGTIGSLILLQSGVDIGGLDVLHATRAGAVGGAIMTLAALVFIPIMFGMFVCLLPMMMLIIMTSMQWLQDRYEEEWNGNSRRIQLPADDLERRLSAEAP